MHAPKSHMESADIDDGTPGPERLEPLQYEGFV